MVTELIKLVLKIILFELPRWKEENKWPNKNKNKKQTWIQHDKKYNNVLNTAAPTLVYFLRHSLYQSDGCCEFRSLLCV